MNRRKQTIMRSNMIINGKMLAEYLDTIKFKKDESDSHLFKFYKETIKANNKTIIIPKETMAKANEYVLVSSPIE